MSELGKVIWITGLSGSGKSTLAKEVKKKFCKRSELVVVLDGDEMREVLGSVASGAENHSRESRLSLALRYSKLCKLISSQGITVIIATISMFEEVHSWNRKNLPEYIEIYLKVPLEVLKNRNSKNIYSLFEEGKISHVAGLDVGVDEPLQPDYIFDYEPGRNAEDIANTLWNDWA